jgi:hypothetical protein
MCVLGLKVLFLEKKEYFWRKILKNAFFDHLTTLSKLASKKE